MPRSRWTSRDVLRATASGTGPVLAYSSRTSKGMTLRAMNPPLPHHSGAYRRGVRYSRRDSSHSDTFQRLQRVGDCLHPATATAHAVESAGWAVESVFQPLKDGARHSVLVSDTMTGTVDS